MGIVASLASVPLTTEIYRDELRREREHREDLKYGRYQHGDADLNQIKRLTTLENEGQGHNGKAESTVNGDDRAGSVFREDASNLEKIYLTGVYKEKYKYMVSRSENSSAIYGGNGNGRKVRSAYPTVRIS